MGADKESRIIEHRNESYVFVPRTVPGGYDVVRLKDQIAVGVFWLDTEDQVYDCVALEGITAADIQQIAQAGIEAGFVRGRRPA